MVGIGRLTGRTSARFTWKQLMTIFNLGANRRKNVNTFRMYRINGRLASLSWRAGPLVGPSSLPSSLPLSSTLVKSESFSSTWSSGVRAFCHR